MSLLTAVAFIAVLLSCSIFFGLTALIASPDSYTEAPYREDESLPADLTAFDRGFYLDASLSRLMTAIDYRVFGRVADRTVLVGRDDFLYPLVSESGDYLYLEDFTGRDPYTRDQLDRLAKALSLRSIAYANAGATYLPVVIPSVQSVYPENLPGGLGEGKGRTRLDQLCAYLDGEDVTLLNLTDALTAAKAYGQVYNNTEDSLSALGAFAAYRAVLDAMPAEVQERAAVIDTVSIFTRATTGKALARTAGVEELIKNRTLSLSNDTILKYTALEKVAGVEITYTLPAYKSEIKSRPAILLEFADDWDKIQLMPFFSNTFGTVGYKTNPAYSAMALDYLSPTVVVQFMHEADLDALLDETVLLSYNDGIGPGEDPFAAMTPVVLGIAQNGADRLCIVGRCERGSTVRLDGVGIAATTTVTGDRFILEVELARDDAVYEATLTASVPGKQVSAPTALTLRLEENETETRVRVGAGGMLFAPESTGTAYTTAYTRPQLRRVEARIRAESTRASTLAGKTVQTVYAYIPDKLDVYGDLAELPASAFAHIPRIAQLEETFAAYSEITFLDFTAPLRAARTAGLQYRTTDTGLSPTGAFTAYTALMNTLAEDDPRLAPLSVSEFLVSNETVPGGDLIEALGLDGASITERLITLTPIRRSVLTTAVGTAAVYTNLDDSLPTALILHDEAGSALLPYLPAHFSRAYVLPEGELSPDDALIAELKPDYILRLTSEYHLPLG